MKHVLFVLTMPNVGSWNGKWTGENRLYCVTKTYSNDSPIPKNVKDKNYFYDFGDGWCANIKCSIIAAIEKRYYNRNSKGFYGYEWMIKEIEEHNRILTLTERREIKK